MKKTNRLIMGSVLGLSAIAIAIDHTSHRLPEPVPVAQEQTDFSNDSEESPCGLDIDSDSSPCGLGD